MFYLNIEKREVERCMTDNSDSGSKGKEKGKEKENKKGLLAEIAAGRKLKKAGSAPEAESMKSKPVKGLAGALSSSDLLKGINRAGDQEHLKPSEVAEEEWVDDDAAFRAASLSASTSSATSSSDESSDKSTTLSSAPKTPDRPLTPTEIAQREKEAAELGQALIGKLGAMRRHIEDPASEDESSDIDDSWEDTYSSKLPEPAKSVSSASVSSTAQSSVVEKKESTPEVPLAANKRPLPSIAGATSTPRPVGARPLPSAPSSAPAALPTGIKPKPNVQKRPMPPAPVPISSAAGPVAIVPSVDTSAIKNKLEGIIGAGAPARSTAASSSAPVVSKPIITQTPTEPTPVVAAAVAATAPSAPITVPTPPKSAPVTAAEKSAVFTPSASSAAASSALASSAGSSKDRAQEVFNFAEKLSGGVHNRNKKHINEQINLRSSNESEYKEIVQEFIIILSQKMNEDEKKYQMGKPLLQTTAFTYDSKPMAGPKI